MAMRKTPFDCGLDEVGGEEGKRDRHVDLTCTAAVARRKGGLDTCNIAAEVFKAELQLLVIKPFGTSAKLATLQLLHDQPQPFDLGLRLGEGGALDRNTVEDVDERRVSLCNSAMTASAGRQAC